jgi:integrase
MPQNRTQGIRPRHSRSCPAKTGGGCTCKPSYEAFVYSPRDRTKIRRTFHTMAAARAWRSDASTAVRKGQLRTPTTTTVREAWEAWLAGARDGTVRTRSGDVYKPSAIHGYEQVMNARVLHDFGARRLSELTRLDLQDFADRMLAEGRDPSTIRNTVMPLRAICRRAVARGELTVNPTAGLELPAVRGKRDRIVSPEEAAKLLAALPEEDRGLWATAFYAGLRRGELLGLRFEDIDLARGRIRVERAFDPVAGVLVAPKSASGVRSVPVPTVLREHLAAQRLRAGRGEGFAFGESVTTPLDSLRITRRAQSIWTVAGLEPIGLHEARHCYASLMIAAGVNAKALSTYMGHSSITITLDRYGHLFPGNEDEAAGQLDAYLLAMRAGARE